MNRIVLIFLLLLAACSLPVGPVPAPVSNCTNTVQCCAGSEDAGIPCPYRCVDGSCQEAVGQAQAKLSPCLTIARGTFGTVWDTQLRSDRPTTSYGTSTNVSVTQSSTSTQHGLFFFDVAAVPACATIQTVDLTLWGLLRSGTPGPVLVHEVTSAWTETSTWATAPSYGPALAIGSTPVAMPTGTGALAAVLPPSLVAGWMGGTNYGFMLETDASSSAGEIFASSDDTNATHRPSLKICYLPAPTCTDTLKNGAETDVDCGGGACPACATGKACALASDCTSGECTGSVCQPPPPVPCTTNADCAAGSYCELGSSMWSPPGGPTCYPLGVSTVASITSCTLPAPVAGAWTMGTTPYKTGVLADVYQPTGARSGRVVVIAHPGGYGSTAIDRAWPNAALYAQALASRGDVAISVDYRLAPANPFPAQDADMRCALRWVASQALTWGANPNRIGCMGYSAGGHLCAHVAMTAEAQAIYDTGIGATIPLDDGACAWSWSASDATLIKVVSSWYGPADLTTQAGTWVPPYLGLATTDPLYMPRAATASPGSWAHPGHPRLFLEAGTADTTVGPSIIAAFEAAAIWHGVAVEKAVVTNGQHFASTLSRVVTQGGLTADYTTASCSNDAFMRSF